MSLPALLRIARVIQRLSVKLFTSQIKRIIPYNVIAVKISALLQDSVNMAAENVLREE